MASTFMFLSLFGLAIAQKATITIPSFDYDGKAFRAAVVSAKPEATVFKLGCPESTPCGLFPYHTLTYGPSTYKMDMSIDGDGLTMTQDCVLAVSSAICRESASGSEANFPGSSTTTYEDTIVSGMTLTVTKGAEKLSAKATPTNSEVSGTAARVTRVTGTPSASGTAAAATLAGAAAANNVGVGGRLVGAAAVLLGGLLL